MKGRSGKRAKSERPLLKLHIFLLQHSGEALTGGGKVRIDRQRAPITRSGGFPALNRLQRLPGCVLRLPVIRPQTRYGD